MMTKLRAYFLRLIAVSFLGVLIRNLLPDGTGKKLTSLCAGLLSALVLLSPLASLELSDAAEAISRAMIVGEETRTGISIDNRTLISDIIKEKTEAYILDKAVQLGIRSCSAEVSVSKNSDYPFPESVRICGKYTKQQREALTAWLAENLAVSEEAQEWQWK